MVAKVFTPLPKTVVPKVYDLTIDTDFTDCTFTGKLEVLIGVKNVGNSVALI